MANLGASVMDSIYMDLSGDASAPSRTVQQRIQIAVASGEPDLLIDSRTNNPGRPNTKFDEFWGKMEEVLNEVKS